MKIKIKKLIINILIVLAGLYLLLVVLFYFFQEKLLFQPQKLAVDAELHFGGLPFRERYIEREDGVRLHGVFFPAREDTLLPQKGLLLYLHGNAGSVRDWGYVAPRYTALGYDVFVWDYRGYGKSGGELGGEALFYADAQAVYDAFKKEYPEEQIVVLGYSIGTGAATWLAANNSPRLLVLQAPYYNLPVLVREKFAPAPTFALRYRFCINELLKKCKSPVVVFHGELDALIPPSHGKRLSQECFKAQDRLFLLPQGEHNGMTDEPDYVRLLKEVL